MRQARYGRDHWIEGLSTAGHYSSPLSSPSLGLGESPCSFLEFSFSLSVLLELKSCVCLKKGSEKREVKRASMNFSWNEMKACTTLQNMCQDIYKRDNNEHR